MVVAFCTKDYGVVFYLSILFFPERLHICCFAFLSFLFPLLIIFFVLPHFFSRALLRTFGDMGGDGEKKGGERFGIMELGCWEDVAWDFQLVFFTCSLYLWFVRLLPWGVRLFFHSGFKGCNFSPFCFSFLFDFREMAFLTKK